MKKLIPINEKEIKIYLDNLIKFWRIKVKEKDPIAECYVDAYQSVRISLFGELLPSEEKI